MNCPDCGTADTRVIETRKQACAAIVKRRHLCGNAHRFWTFQLHESVVRSIGLKQLQAQSATSARGAVRRTLAFKRNLRVASLLADGWSVRSIAEKLDISDARVRQLRLALAKASAATPNTTSV